MSTLIFRPNTHIDANMFQYRMDLAGIKTHYDPFTGDFIINTGNNIADIEIELESTIAYDIEGHFYTRSS